MAHSHGKGIHNYFMLCLALLLPWESGIATIAPESLYLSCQGEAMRPSLPLDPIASLTTEVNTLLQEIKNFQKTTKYLLTFPFSML